MITLTGGAQALVQAAGLLSGLLIVRVLSTQEYALYTIANTMFGTMVILADSGISSGVLAIGGKVWQDKKKLGDVIETGLFMRRRFAIISLIIAIPILYYLITRQGTGLLATILIILSIIPAFTSTISDTLLEITPKLHQDIRSLQKNQLQVSIFRLLLNCVILFIFPFAHLAILCSGLPRLYGNIKLRKIANNFIDKGSYRKDVQQEITRTVKRVMPGAVFYCVSGQITVWLISLSGNSTSIAEIGALGRLTAVFTLFNVVFATLIVPRYARLNDNKLLLIKNYFRITITTVFILGIVCMITLFFSHQLLAIIGSKYYGLENELFIYVLTTCIGLISGIHVSLSSSRGWFIKPIINIPIELIALIVGIFIFDLSTLRGVLFYNLYLNGIYLSQYLMYFIYCLYNKTIK